MRISAIVGPKKKYVYEFTTKYAIKNVAMIGRRRTGPVSSSLANLSLLIQPTLSRNQPEMERGRSPLVSIPPFGQGFFKAWIRPPGYPSTVVSPQSLLPFRSFLT